MSQSNTHISLDDIRTRISSIDNELLRLLSERRKVSLDVAKSKIETQKPVRDIEREQALLVRLIEAGKELQLDSVYISQVFQTIIADSVLYQQSYLQNLANQNSDEGAYRVAFLGPNGSYSSLATKNYFSRQEKQLIKYPESSFKAILRKVEDGHVDYGVLPIENTNSGSINDVYDILQHTSVSIVGEITLPIQHAILVAKDTSMDKIHTLYSHSQPHTQCSDFIETLGNVKLEFCSSTAEAMAQVQKMNSAEVAAIGNAESGKLYDLSVLREGIANQTENYTRFIVIARKPVEVTNLIPAKTTLVMTTGQEPGALVECLLILRNHHINMTKLESRPLKGNPWEEIFYMDLDANMADVTMQQAFKQLQDQAKFVKVLGCYPIENVKPVTLDI